jgi:nanoRNase/pAp phosphatase (c-di-AMP/oligoRNAs hydrolase)
VDAATAELNARIFRNTGFDSQQVEQLNALLTGFRRDAGDFS